VSEAMELFSEILQDLEEQSKRISDHSLQIMAVRVTTQTI
jgi:vacuolar-type H+-ATPase subunit E/Vma4